MSTFSALILSLPTRSSTVRMRVWRALKGSGCGVLRDGVYLLPHAANGDAFGPVEDQVRAGGGFAMTVDVDFRTAKQAEHARRLFDRSNEYGDLVKRMEAARAGLSKQAKREAESMVQRFEKEFEELSGIDFFPGEARSQAESALRSLREARRLIAEGEPHALAGKVRLLDRGRYQRRVWATRKSPWVDRLASAWLVKRFIDKEARFAWIEHPRKRPKNAIGFDYDGAEFTHIGSRVTFEVLMASFGLDADPSLVSIASAIHFLDAGGIPVPEAKGLETMLRGIVEKARSDDERVARANRVFDLMYAGYSTG